MRVGDAIKSALFLCGAAVVAQSPAPQFEVVSIKPVPRNAPMTVREVGFTAVLPGGQYVDSRTPVLFLIVFAYNVKNPSTQLIGFPAWVKEDSFSIAAKPAAGFPLLPPKENIEQVRMMMRAMLADRFHLRLHTETREEPIFNLELTKGGFKFKDAGPPAPPEKSLPVGAAMDDESGRMIGKKSTMTSLASALVIFLKRPVVDATGLQGYYDFDVQWRAPEQPEVTPRMRGMMGVGIGQLNAVLQDKFGLQLKKATGPVEYWVVDSVEHPTEN
jgi:uncharacterized protein (TIGR03435 family)